MNIKQVIKEELTRADEKRIKQIFNSEFKKMLNDTNLKTKVEDIVKKQLKNDAPTKKEVAKISQKVLVKLFKTFWVRRSFWSNNLENI